MNAYDFIVKLLLNIESADTVFGMREKEFGDWDDAEFQYIIARDCRVKPGKVILALSNIEDEDPGEEYIDTLYKLRDFFKKNNVSKNDKIYIYPLEGGYLLKDFTIGTYKGTTAIICDYDWDKMLDPWDRFDK
jgi:hypothetical protein